MECPVRTGPLEYISGPLGALFSAEGKAGEWSVPWERVLLSIISPKRMNGVYCSCVHG